MLESLLDIFSRNKAIYKLIQSFIKNNVTSCSCNGTSWKLKFYGFFFFFAHLLISNSWWLFFLTENSSSVVLFMSSCSCVASPPSIPAWDTKKFMNSCSSASSPSSPSIHPLDSNKKVNGVVGTRASLNA